MELVDVTDSKSVGGDIVWVRVPPPAPDNYNPILIFLSEERFGLFILIQFKYGITNQELIKSQKKISESI